MNFVTDKDGTILLNLDKTKTSNNVTSEEVEESVEGAVTTEKARDGLMDDTSGICVNYNRRLYDKAGAVTANDWCSAYEKGCTSFSRDTTDPNCLRNQEIRRLAAQTMARLMEEADQKDRRKELLDGLKAALREAVKTQSR
jgi:hypothetical protein